MKEVCSTFYRVLEVELDCKVKGGRPPQFRDRVLQFRDSIAAGDCALMGCPHITLVTFVRDYHQHGRALTAQELEAKACTTGRLGASRKRGFTVAVWRPDVVRSGKAGHLDTEWRVKSIDIPSEEVRGDNTDTCDRVYVHGHGANTAPYPPAEHVFSSAVDRADMHSALVQALEATRDTWGTKALALAEAPMKKLLPLSDDDMRQMCALTDRPEVMTTDALTEAYMTSPAMALLDRRVNGTKTAKDTVPAYQAYIPIPAEFADHPVADHLWADLNGRLQPPEAKQDNGSSYDHTRALTMWQRMLLGYTAPGDEWRRGLRARPDGHWRYSALPVEDGPALFLAVRVPQQPFGGHDWPYRTKNDIVNKPGWMDGRRPSAGAAWPTRTHGQPHPGPPAQAARGQRAVQRGQGDL